MGHRPVERLPLSDRPAPLCVMSLAVRIGDRNLRQRLPSREALRQPSGPACFPDKGRTAGPAHVTRGGRLDHDESERHWSRVRGVGSDGRLRSVWMKSGRRWPWSGRDRSKLEQTRAALSEAGRAAAVVLPCDVADRRAVDAMAKQVLDAFGTIDVLVCNAGHECPETVSRGPRSRGLGRD